MVRKPRLKPTVETAFQHVTTRTAQQEPWLEDPAVKEILIDLIDFYSEVFYVDVLAYVVMSNHYHLCLAVHRPALDPEDIERRYELAQSRLKKPIPFDESMIDSLYERYTDLSKLMATINRNTAIAHNAMKGTKGSMWGDRFWNRVIEPGQSVMNVVTYIEMNPVRAKIVTDPTDFPYSSVGRTRAALERDEQPTMPPIDCLTGLPEQTRAQIYVDFIRFIALTEREPDLQSQGLPTLLTSLGRQIDMRSIHEALATRAPANWSKPIYGSDDFTRETLIRAGWLIPMTPPNKAARDGPDNQVA